jgi:cell wall assembly regulator SMI1
MLGAMTMTRRALLGTLLLLPQTAGPWTLAQGGSPAMNISIAELFAAVAKVAPGYAARLNSPASEAALADVERARNLQIPPLLKELWRKTDGEQLGLMLGVELIPLARVAAQPPATDSFWDSIADNPHLVQDRYADPRRLPFAEDYGGSVWYLDFDPAAEGTPGQVIVIFRDMPETIYCVAPSFEAFVAIIMAEIKAGRVQAGEDGRLQFDWMQQGSMYVPTVALNARLAKPNPQPPPAGRMEGLSPLWHGAIVAPMRNVLERKYLDQPLDDSVVALIKEIEIQDAAMLDDMGVLAHFDKLQFVNFNVPTAIGAAQLQGLAGKRITNLRVAGPVSGLAALSTLPVLHNLTLLADVAAEATAIAGFTRLRQLSLRLNRTVPFAEWLKPLAALKELSLFSDGNYEVSEADVEVLAALPQLGSAAFYGVRYFDARPLRQSRSLTHLSVFPAPAG